MKKLSVLLVILLIFAGCGNAAPANTSQSVSEPVSSLNESERSESDEKHESSSSLPDMPAPDSPPVTEIGAIELPNSVFTSNAGYSVEVLTPAQYDAEMPLNRGGFRGFLTCDFFMLGQGGKIAVANAKGKLITDFVFSDDGSGWYAIEGIVPLNKAGNAGTITATEGKETVPFKYDHVWPVMNSELIQARHGDTTEILDRTGKAIFTLERGDEIYALGGKTIVILQDGMLKFYDFKDYRPITNFSCEDMLFASKPENSVDDIRLAVNVGGQWGLCTLDGKFVVEPMYDEIGYFNGEYTDFIKNGKKGVLRFDGKVVVRPEWDDLIVCPNSVSVCKDGKWGAITDIDSGKIEIEPMYDFISMYGKDGNASFERNGKYGLLDREGNEIIPAKYDTMISSVDANLDKGYYLLEGENGPFSGGIIGGGKVILPNDHYIVSGREGEPYNLVLTPREKWGYIDRTGKFVIDAKFDNADAFIKDRNVAFVEKDGKISLIDRKGNSVLDTVFSDVIAYNPDTMVCAMEYTNEQGKVKTCLAKINIPA